MCWRKQPLKRAAGRDNVLLPHHGQHQSHSDTQGQTWLTTPGRQRAAVQDICSMAERAGCREPTPNSSGQDTHRTIKHQLCLPENPPNHQCCGDPIPHPLGLGPLTPSVGLFSSTVSTRQARHSLECGSHGWRYGGAVHPPQHSCDSRDAVWRAAPALQAGTRPQCPRDS